MRKCVNTLVNILQNIQSLNIFLHTGFNKKFLMNWMKKYLNFN